jgi:uncharacterized protein with HEPN domain
MARRFDIVLEEVLQAISLIESATSSHDRASLAGDLFVQRGIERLLEIISEAARHLPDEMLAARPEIAWADIRAIGNLIRHEYWRVDPDIVWAVVIDDLPPLRAAVEDLLSRQRG